jgi:alpha-D-ribose 1-methylphosphonate 5-phosphate C-P lyase
MRTGISICVTIILKEESLNQRLHESLEAYMKKSGVVSYQRRQGDLNVCIVRAKRKRRMKHDLETYWNMSVVIVTNKKTFEHLCYCYDGEIKI